MDYSILFDARQLEAVHRALKMRAALLTEDDFGWAAAASALLTFEEQVKAHHATAMAKPMKRRCLCHGEADCTTPWVTVCEWP